MRRLRERFIETARCYVVSGLKMSNGNYYLRWNMGVVALLNSKSSNMAGFDC